MNGINKIIIFIYTREVFSEHINYVGRIIKLFIVIMHTVGQKVVEVCYLCIFII